MDEDDRSAEEAKRRVILWALSAVSGISATVALSLGYWLVSIAIESRDHVRFPHITRIEYLEAEQRARQEIARELKEIDARLLEVENGKP